MSTTASSDGGYRELGHSQDDFQSAQPVQVAERVSRRQLKQEGDIEEDDPTTLPPVLSHGDSNSDEYLPSPVQAKRKGKERASDTSHQPSLHNITRTTTHHDHPNRFSGPQSTWLSWTRSERESIKSLDQERAENLSAHLYVAHKIKKHARSIEQPTRLNRDKGRARSTDRKEKVRMEQKAFVPPKVWTAWPMPPEQVPRVFHTTGILDEDDPFTFKAAQDTRPSAELEECLIATMTRIARKRWEARDWADCSSDVPHSDFNKGSESNPRAPQQASAPPRSRTQRDSSSPPPVFFSSQPPAAAAAATIPQHSFSAPPQTSHTNIPSSPESPSHSRSRSRSRSPPQSLPRDLNLHPVPIADDSRARTLLLPATRRIISQLDDLLLALHRSRSAYATKPSSSGNDSSTQTPTEAEFEIPGSRSQSRSRGSGGGGKRKASRRKSSRRLAGEKTDDDDDDDDDDDEEEDGRSEPASRDRKRSSNPSTTTTTAREAQLARLGLRDWSDVLGIAALRGWGGDVVARAGERCAGLSGEDMRVRTFGLDLGNRGGKGKGKGKVWVEEGLVSGRSSRRRREEEEEVVRAYDVEEEEEEEGGDDDENDDDDDDGDSIAAAPSTAAEAEPDSFYPPDDAAAAAAPPSSSIGRFPCPHPACHRHHPSPFHTEENLASHLKTQHLQIRQLNHSPPPTLREDEEDIFCPIPTCFRHRQHTDQPFSRGNLLYRHVRRVHPGVDLGVVKEGERVRRKSLSRSRSRGVRRKGGGEGRGQERGKGGKRSELSG